MAFHPLRLSQQALQWALSLHREPLQPRTLSLALLPIVWSMNSCFSVASAQRQTQQRGFEEDGLGISSTTAAALGVAALCVIIGGVLFLLRSRSLEITPKRQSKKRTESVRYSAPRKELSESLLTLDSLNCPTHRRTTALEEIAEIAQKKRKRALSCLAAQRERLWAEKEAEEERLAQEKRKKEQEEYEEWKATFKIEAEGELQISPEEEAQQLERFLRFIRMRKAVDLEEIAAEFGLKTKDCVKRLESLRECGRLCGVLDDRGRFLCLTEEELQKVAAALKSQGRFSKDTDLVSICNRIIRLTPSEDDKARIEEEQRNSMRLVELATADD
ncbi:hypothetical protein cyc_04622 [Cyclospora cayetanensis]|uniref:DDRGK domain-containing protein 1 n=1 Tax=Cyclospora cayetanensis TaxID=88456 RepID=A0A1D3D4D6_9EIME|nr:hypothetical protein cyc_04622 [Cyclospora cayetanensis]